MFTVETITETRNYGYCDNRGYLYCGKCVTPEVQALGKMHSACCDDDRCERCGELATITVTGTTVVEHVPCKIF